MLARGDSRFRQTDLPIVRDDAIVRLGKENPAVRDVAVLTTGRTPRNLELRQ